MSLQDYLISDMEAAKLEWGSPPRYFTGFPGELPLMYGLFCNSCYNEFLYRNSPFTIEEAQNAICNDCLNKRNNK